MPAQLNTPDMSHHLLAAAFTDPAGAPAGYYVTRLVLSAGTTADELAHDLRTNFATPDRAQQLCMTEYPVRGLPSRGSSLTAEESTLLPRIPERVNTQRDVASIADDLNALTITVFDGVQWLRLLADGDDFELEPLNDMKLFRVIVR